MDYPCEILHLLYTLFVLFLKLYFQISWKYFVRAFATLALKLGHFQTKRVAIFLFTGLKMGGSIKHSNTILFFCTNRNSVISRHAEFCMGCCNRRDCI